MIALNIKNTGGNPAGVIFNADHLTTAEMQVLNLYMWLEALTWKVIIP